MPDSTNPTVYSTNLGRICPKCQNPIKNCVCKTSAKIIINNKDGIVRLSLERKGRGGKVVTIISGLPTPPQQIKLITKEIKQKCGTGGSSKDGIIEIQGDVRQVVFDFLKEKGFKIKIAGG